MPYRSGALINHTRLSLLKYEIKLVSAKQPGSFLDKSSLLHILQWTKNTNAVGYHMLTEGW